jgi:hypothetical protein
MMRRLIVLALVVLAGAACFAPKPRVVREELKAPEEKGGAWELAVTVANDGPGEGEAEITSRLRDRHGAVVAQEQRQIDLRPHETVTVTLELRPSQPGPYRTASEVQSPPM